jgi:2-methylcitrate dehydratase PrpD
MTTGDTPLTRALADLIAGFTWSGLPADVQAAVQRVVRDGTADLLTAADPAYTTGRRIARFVEGLGGRPEASVVGHGFKTDCVGAALANGTMGYACDIEPFHPEAILHPIAVVVPTALAVGESVGAAGMDFLGAVALGCEVEYRVSMAIGPAAQYALGFHPSAVCGTFGAAAAAAHLIGLDAEACVRALGLAACQASGLMAWESDPTENARPFQMGLAARGGITAALLAAKGFGGPIGVFDHGHTVYRAFGEEGRSEHLTRDLGQTWRGITELAIKPYPCVAFLHPALDALLGLVAEHNLKAEQIAKMVMHFAKSGVHCIDGNPLKSHSAQYVLPVAVAARALRILDLFEDRRLSDPAIAALAGRTHVVADEGELEAIFPAFYAARVEIHTADGRRLERRNDIARGYPRSPLGEDELVAKFRALVGAVASPARVDALLAAVHDLPRARNLTRYAELLRSPVGA